MKPSWPLIIYIHGFNSSPDSEKAKQFAQYCRQQRIYDIEIPALSHNPETAVSQLETLINSVDNNLFLLVGSSLGGYYATYLGEKYCCRAVLVNPAVSPVKYLGEEFLGMQKNLYTGEEYEFTREHAMYLDSLDIDPLGFPENYLLLVQTGDEVLDYRLALERYAESTQIVQEGGSHRFENFSQMMPAMMEFAKQGVLTPQTRTAINSIEKLENTLEITQ